MRCNAIEFVRRARSPGGIGELGDVIDAGDQVVIMRPRATGNDEPGLRAAVTAVRDGKAVEMVAYDGPVAALAAVDQRRTATMSLDGFIAGVGGDMSWLSERLGEPDPREFARHFRGHPFIVIPQVMTDLSGERVLVSEWVHGTRFEQVKERDGAARDRFAEIVFRFFFGSLYRDGHFSGDPHPGNYLLLDDGRVAFIDFGMTKRIAPDRIEREKAAIRDALDGDASGVREELAALGFFAADDASVDSQEILAYVRSLHECHAEDRPFTITSSYVTGLIASGAPGSRNWELEKHLSLPPEAIVSRRLETLVIGVMGQLEATANWHPIMGELLGGDAPSTAFGEQERAFFGPATQAQSPRVNERTHDREDPT